MQTLKNKFSLSPRAPKYLSVVWLLALTLGAFFLAVHLHGAERAVTGLLGVLVNMALMWLGLSLLGVELVKKTRDKPTTINVTNWAELPVESIERAKQSAQDGVVAAADRIVRAFCAVPHLQLLLVRAFDNSGQLRREIGAALEFLGDDAPASMVLGYLAVIHPALVADPQKADILFGAQKTLCWREESTGQGVRRGRGGADKGEA